MRETSLLLCLLLVAEGRNQVSVPPGADASLRCVGPRGATIALLEWVRPDLSPDGYVFFYREEQLYENYLHPQFVGRAELRDPQMRDGDVSVVLKNVTRADAGSYDCFISVSKPGRRRRATPDFSRTVELLVEDAEEVTRRSEPEQAGERTWPSRCRVSLRRLWFWESPLKEKRRIPSFYLETSLRTRRSGSGGRAARLDRVTSSFYLLRPVINATRSNSSNHPVPEAERPTTRTEPELQSSDPQLCSRDSNANFTFHEIKTGSSSTGEDEPDATNTRRAARNRTSDPLSCSFTAWTFAHVTTIDVKV